MNEIELQKKSIHKRIFFLRRAEERAQNPHWKAMWRVKINLLMKKAISIS